MEGLLLNKQKISTPLRTEPGNQSYFVLCSAPIDSSMISPSWSLLINTVLDDISYDTLRHMCSARWGS